MAYSSTPSSSTLINQGPGMKHEPLIKTERLSSFKLPRDLTLGGSLNSVRIPKNAPPKRVYAPNVNAIRNKNSEVKTSRDTTLNRGRGRGRGERGKSDRGGRGNGRGGGKNSLVQTSGLFSEGTGETHLRKSSAVYNRGDKNDSVSTLRRPTIVKRDIKIDPEIEQKNIKEILGELDDDYEDVPSISDYYTPVGLHEIKSEIKKENQFFPTVKKEDNVNLALKYPEDLDEFFGRHQPQLFLLQLPDSLPGEGPDEEPADSAELERSSSPDPASRYCTMKQLDEGLIGKIVRYKSGKSKLVIGQTRFDIDLGMDPGLLQVCVERFVRNSSEYQMCCSVDTKPNIREEAMSVTTNRTERSGNLINLGQIQAKLNAIPDWEYMLLDKS